MSENKEPGMAFNMPKLHKIMAVLSFIFFITTVWVFLDDYKVELEKNVARF